MQIKMSLTIYTVVRLVSAIDNTGCFTAYGRARISNQIECELRIDAEVAAKRQKSQRKGIEAAKKAGRHYGRPQTTFPENWDVVYAQWKAQDITADEAAVKLGISKATLYRMEKGEA